MRLPNAMLIAALLMICSGEAFAWDNLVINPGFEGPLNYVADWPNQYGRWGGDIADIAVGPTNGITPAEGQGMLHFEASHYTRYGATSGCQAVQAIDIGAHSALVSSGGALATASVWFNRVAGDAQTDTEFAIRLFAYSGTVDQHYGLKVAGAHLLRHDTVLFSDADPDTWEVATVSMWLPAETDFFTVEIAANENVYNDLDPPEFDGHYADGVVVTIVPEPATMGLLALGGLAVLRRRSR